MREFLVKLDDADIKDLLKAKFKNLKPDGDNFNAFTHSDRGEQQAIKDILVLMDLYGMNFVYKIQELYDKYATTKDRIYSSACDKQNSDSWWLSGYEDIAEMFVEIKKKKVRKE